MANSKKNVELFKLLEVLVIAWRNFVLKFSLKASPKKAYTLTELVVVFVVLLILAYMVVPNLLQVTQASRQSAIQTTAAAVLDDADILATANSVLPSSIDPNTGQPYIYTALNELPNPQAWYLLPSANTTYDPNGYPLTYTIEPKNPQTTVSTNPFACIFLPTAIGGTGSVTGTSCTLSNIGGPGTTKPVSGTPGSPISFIGTATGTTVDLSWYPNPSGGTPASYLLYRSFDNQTPILISTLSSSTTSYADTGLSGGVYTYSIQASNAQGTSSTSSTTPIEVAAAPGAPVNLTGLTSGYGVTLNWDPPVSGGAPLSYLIYREPYGSGPFALVGTTPASITTFQDSNLQIGTYTYEVIASNLSGDSVAATVQPSSVFVPVPTGLSDSVANNNVTLTWTPPAVGGTPASYILFQNNQKIGTVSGITTTFVQDGVANGGYTYAVAAQNAAGAISDQDILPVTVTSGSPSPTNFTGSATGQTVNLTWVAPPGPTPVSYSLYTNLNSLIATLPGSSLGTSLSNVAAGLTQYTLEANYSSSVSAPANTAVTVYSAPGSPTSITESVSNYQVNISWEPPAAGGPISGYSIYQGSTLLGNVSASTLNYVTPALSPGTYTFNVFANNASGSSSSPASIQAKVIAIAPTNLTATVNSDSVTLAWSPGSSGDTPASYLIYKNGALFATVVGTTTGYTDTSAGFGNFTYVVQAESSNGTLSQSISASLTISNTPGSPTNPTATVNGSTVTITWSAPTSGGAPTSYLIYRNGVQVGSVSGSTYSYSDSGLTPSSYTYGVAAENSGGVSATTNVPQPVSVIPVPDAPTSFSVTQQNYNAALSWNAPTGGPGDSTISSYIIERNGALLAIVPASQTTYVDTTVAPGSYSYSVAATNATGTGASATASITLIEYPPTDLTNSIANAQVTLNWSPPTSGGSPQSYWVLRDNALIGTVGGSTTTFTDTTSSAGNTYTYGVEAINANGTPSAAITTTASVSDLPASPTNFAAVPSGTSVGLSWGAPASGGSPVSYLLYQNGALIATLPNSQTTYTVSNLTPGNSYTFAVAAYNNAGASPLATSNASASVYIPLTPDTPSLTSSVNGSTANLSWTASTSGGAPSSYNLYLGSSLIEVIPSSTTSYTASNLAPGTYNFYLSASNSTGTSAQAETSPTIIGQPPTNLTVSVSGNTATLNWTASTSSQVAGYYVYKNGSSTPIVLGNVTSYVDSTLAQGTTTTYSVATDFSNGTISALSNTVSAIDPTVGPTPTINTKLDTQTTLNVSWTASPGNSVTYVAYVNGSTSNANCTTTSTSCTIGGLTPGTIYSVNVQATPLNNPSVSGPQASAETVPSAPTLTGDSVSYSSIALSWSAPTGSNYYQVDRNGIAVYDGNSTSFTDTGLNYNTTYSYTFYAAYYGNTVFSPASSTYNIKSEGCQAGTATYLSGGNATFTMPTACTTLKMQALGTAGTSSNNGYGGGTGADLIANFVNQAPGTAYYVVVGAGRYPDGGPQGNAPAGNGGGSSGVYPTNTSAWAYLIAGGGGGGGNSGGGGAAASIGLAGTGAGGNGGNGAGWTCGSGCYTGFFGGSATGAYAGNGGCLAQYRSAYFDLGGNGFGNSTSAGGGGGGGFCGGAGGSTDNSSGSVTNRGGGGGGGSSYINYGPYTGSESGGVIYACDGCATSTTGAVYMSYSQ
jgi:type II secretory pathway pseudopilin PulG